MSEKPKYHEHVQLVVSEFRRLLDNMEQHELTFRVPYWFKREAERALKAFDAADLSEHAAQPKKPRYERDSVPRLIRDSKLKLYFSIPESERDRILALLNDAEDGNLVTKDECERRVREAEDAMGTILHLDMGCAITAADLMRRVEARRARRS